MRCPLVFALLVVGCGSSKPPPKASAAPTDGAPVPTSATSMPCLVTNTTEMPPGWVETGTLVIAAANGRPTKITVNDANGKLVASEAAANDENQFGDQAEALACRASAWLMVRPHKPTGPDTTEVTFKLARPAKNDEAADVAMLCTMPKEAAGSAIDDAQRTRIAAAVYAERLTSVKYRGWFYDLDKQLGAAKSDEGAVAVKQANGQKLTGMLKAGGKADADACWFAKILAAK